MKGTVRKDRSNDQDGYFCPICVVHPRCEGGRMRYALVNPQWTYEGSVYFGCREPHLPLEYGYAKRLLQREWHEAEIIDAHLERLSPEDLYARVEAFSPDLTVICTAPSYLFWRCPPPELRVPMETARLLREVGGILVAVGPHPSATPRIALRKLDVDAVVVGECEEALAGLADRARWPAVASIAYRDGADIRVQGAPAVCQPRRLEAVHWPNASIQAHTHHHHRFDTPPQGPGAELETSRGCPYRCSFCAKRFSRDQYRKRPLAEVLEELDTLLSQGVEYVYFIDEIFLPDRDLLQALVKRQVKFGMQTRIDLWDHNLLSLLGRAGCVSLEVGMESISEEGRARLNKHSRLSTEDMTERLIHAKQHVAFVQANLTVSESDDLEQIEVWRERLRRFGVWANKPAPLFPYPGSPMYTQRWGEPDDSAWERAHDCYLQTHAEFSDIQEERALPLGELEGELAHGR